MPRTSDGTFSLPAGTLVNTGDDIVPSQHNPAFQDVEQALTDSLSRDGRGGMRANLNMNGFRARNLAPGTQPNDAATVSQISGSGGVPVGTIVDFAGTNPPSGWLIAAGQTLSRTSYADLFAAIGTAFGAPDSSTFSIPDLRGRVSAGRDIDQGGYANRLTSPNSRTLGNNGGTEAVALTANQLPIHTHAVEGETNITGGHTHRYTRANNIFTADNGSTFAYASGLVESITASDGLHSHNINFASGTAGNDDPHTNVQPTIILTKIIKVSAF